ncbi:MAG: tetratricopeptide repeat protein [bacterium]|nr:tetratricopeptide repeat protein [bacterium]
MNRISILFTVSILIYFSLTYASTTQPEQSAIQNLYNQGIELLKQEKYAEATTVFEQYLTTDSTNAKAYYNLGLAYVYLEKYDNAVAAWKKAIELDPEFEAAYYNLGLVYIHPQAYRTQEAINTFQTVVKLNPKNYKAYYQLAVGYHRIGKYQEALQALDTVLQLKPDLTTATEFKIQIYQTLRDYPSAIQLADTLYRKAKTEQNKAMLFNLYVAYGIQLRNQNKYNESVSQLYTAQKLVPDHPQVFYELANTYSLMGRINSAEMLYEYCLARDPKSPTLLNNLAYFYAENGFNLDRATLLIDSALRLVSAEPDSNPTAYLDTKGWIELKKGNYLEAYNHFQTVLDTLIAPYQPEPGLNEKELEAFLAVQPNYAAFPEVMQARYQLALSAWYCGKNKEARDLLNQILAVSTEEPAAVAIQQKVKTWLGEK